MSNSKKRLRAIEKLKRKGRLTPDQERQARDLNQKATAHEAITEARRRLNG